MNEDEDTEAEVEFYSLEELIRLRQELDHIAGPTKELLNSKDALSNSIAKLINELSKDS